MGLGIEAGDEEGGTGIAVVVEGLAGVGGEVGAGDVVERLVLWKNLGRSQSIHSHGRSEHAMTLATHLQSAGNVQLMISMLSLHEGYLYKILAAEQSLKSELLWVGMDDGGLVKVLQERTSDANRCEIERVLV